MTKIFTNKEIYNFYFLINENIINENIVLPIKVNFAIQKNFTLLLKFNSILVLWTISSTTKG